MVDSFYVNDLSKYVNVFYNKGINNSWQTWTKPRNISFIDILVIGAGGGGGVGYASNGGAAGASGGGSGAITKGFFPANLLPDTLYIQVGQGGVGGSGLRGTAGSDGTDTTIIVDTPISVISSQQVLLLSNGGSGGLAGTSVSLVAGGAGGVVWIPNSIASSLGIVDTFAGTAGGPGSATSGVITNVIPTSIVSGGAGGGSVASVTGFINGGSVIASGFTITINGGIAGDGSDRTLIDANPGFTSLPSTNTSNRLPMFFTGGAGGGACNTNNFGGNGGNGSFGSGGGGGGGTYSTTNTQGGRGGRGGDGLVIITCY